MIEAIEEMELREFYAEYRADGHGRAAYEPSMVVALLLYAYATKQRSARAKRATLSLGGEAVAVEG